ncbi:MAG: DUF721 domain-containing protein [Tabrizicola sp.]|uniref:DUF721 domain-containing protein n=1 Tax=Tabrizicola sp. TaxID=2005166 RepID=UPI0027352FFF|nr:DUF721 domain-containing protein [Tabrizicola sp.]MDP3262693.1 DUF721 domain-containing protein [Tabrizicola sp.]MDP3647372.1 DUF721 domain-containing protein [Paracoccaceae bacterium]MDZ4066777.1 DUF721 domain-containing protein [Tabrizicola sp.]
MARKPASATLPPPSPVRRMRGFEAAAGLVKEPVRTVGETRGFAVARLLTHWAEVVGADMARVSRPVEIGYGHRSGAGGFGATLTVLVNGAHAPMLEMQKERLRERVNAVYGYAAVSHIRLTQTSATGFAEGQAEFVVLPKAAPAPDPVLVAKAAEAAEGVGDPDLRAALAALAQNILNRRN